MSAARNQLMRSQALLDAGHRALEVNCSEMSGAGFTPEDRARAAVVLRAKVAAGARFRRDYLDAVVWEKKAAQRGIRLPAWWVPPTPRALKRWLRKLRPEADFRHVYGDKMTAAKLITLNPEMPLRAFVGQMLEEAQ